MHRCTLHWYHPVDAIGYFAPSSTKLTHLETRYVLPMQMVVVTDGALANMVLGRRLGLDKAMEPALSDELLSIGGHHTMFSAGGSTKSTSKCPLPYHCHP